MSIWTDGACVGKPAGLFVPDPEDDTHDEKVARAKSICETCPFKAKCLDIGRSEGRVGVWGGELLTLPEEEASATTAEKK